MRNIINDVKEIILAAATIAPFLIVPELRHWALPMTALCVVLLAGAYWWKHYRLHHGLRVEFATDYAHLHDAYEMGRRVYERIGYGEFYPTLEVVKKWCDTYRCGVIQLRYAQNPPLAYLSVWPLKGDAYEKIRAGKMAEDELTPDHIEREGGAYRYWYLADVCNIDLDRNERRDLATRDFASLGKYLTYKVIAEGFRLLLEKGQLATTFSVLALGVTPPGKELLIDTFTFHQEREVPFRLARRGRKTGKQFSHEGKYLICTRDLTKELVEQMCHDMNKKYGKALRKRFLQQCKTRRAAWAEREGADAQTRPPEAGAVD